jgi:hypothetical protein
MAARAIAGSIFAGWARGDLQVASGSLGAGGVLGGWPDRQGQVAGHRLTSGRLEGEAVFVDDERWVGSPRARAFRVWVVCQKLGRATSWLSRMAAWRATTWPR